jgi:hypothetical protein
MSSSLLSLFLHLSFHTLNIITPFILYKARFSSGSAARYLSTVPGFVFLSSKSLIWCCPASSSPTTRPDDHTIRAEVCEENTFIFGLKTSEVAKFKAKSYDSLDCYNANSRLKHVIDPIAQGLFSLEKQDLFRPIIDLV